MIHVGVDAWNLPFDRRGIGRYLRSLLDVWADDFADRIRISLIVPEWATWIARRRYTDAVGRSYPVRTRAKCDRFGFDVLWFPWNGPSWTNFRTPAVATLHDAMPFELPGFDDARRATFIAAAATCRQLIADSTYSAQALARVLSVDRERLTAIPLGVATPATHAQSATSGMRAPSAANWVRNDSARRVKSLGRFVLFVGETDRRKGIDTLVTALAQVDAPRPSLVIAGRPSDPIVPVDGVTIHALGHVDNETLAELYRQCAVFAFPSRYEGFGLPVLEAMSYGAPVVASSATSIPEAGGDAAVYVPPDEPDALAAALTKVLRDETHAAELRARGLARARTMTWERTAEATLRVFESAAEHANRPAPVQ